LQWRSLEEAELELETTYYFKRSGEFLYIIGDDWPVYDIGVKAKFIFEELEFDAEVVYKHPQRLGVQIPEMPGIAPGI